MTPDELRRMDNDLCIIFEKGLKPIKAKKYYYFNKPIARKLKEFTLDHNNFNGGERGEWRKFNPANPYNDNEKEDIKDLDIETLDDLFDDDLFEDEINEKTDDNTKQIEPKIEQNVNLLKEEDKSEQNNAPILPMVDNSEEDELFTKDLQQELEAKFDELFGPIDNNNNG